MKNNIVDKKFIKYSKFDPIAINAINSFKLEGITIKFNTSSGVLSWTMNTKEEADYVMTKLGERLCENIDSFLQYNVNEAAKRLDVNPEKKTVAAFVNGKVQGVPDPFETDGPDLPKLAD